MTGAEQERDPGEGSVTPEAPGAPRRASFVTRWAIPLGLVWAGLLLSIWVWDQVPKESRVDPLRSAVTLLGAPILALLGLVGLRAVERKMPGVRGRLEDLVVAWVLAFLIGLHVLVLLVAMGKVRSLSGALPIASGLFLTGLGPLLAKLPYQSAMGIRTPITLSSATAWQRTHRLLGSLFPVAGVLGLVALRLDGVWLLIGAFSPAFLALSVAILHGSKGAEEHRP